MYAQIQGFLHCTVAMERPFEPLGITNTESIDTKIKWNRAFEQTQAKIKVSAAVQLQSQGYSKQLASAYLLADLRQCNLYSKLRFNAPVISGIQLQRSRHVHMCV